MQAYIHLLPSKSNSHIELIKVMSFQVKTSCIPDSNLGMAQVRSESGVNLWSVMCWVRQVYIHNSLYIAFIYLGHTYCCLRWTDKNLIYLYLKCISGTLLLGNRSNLQNINPFNFKAIYFSVIHLPKPYYIDQLQNQ